jgi:uncharacterized protein YgiM (DUF1202 family)
VKTYVNTVNKGTLNLRAEPSLNARVLAQIPYGTELETNTITGEWSQVTYNGKIGYVMSKFLGDKTKVSKEDLLRIYNSLKSTLATIESVLK